MRLHHLLLGAALAALPATALAQSTTAPAAAPSASAPTAQPGKSAPPATGGTGMSSGTSSAMSASRESTGSLTHYPTEAAATSACSGDTVVWANPKSKVLHASGSKSYGKTKSGFYACEKQAEADGFHMAGKHSHAKKTAG